MLGVGFRRLFLSNWFSAAKSWHSRFLATPLATPNVSEPQAITLLPEDTFLQCLYLLPAKLDTDHSVSELSNLVNMLQVGNFSDAWRLATDPGLKPTLNKVEGFNNSLRECESHRATIVVTASGTVCSNTKPPSPPHRQRCRPVQRSNEQTRCPNRDYGVCARCCTLPAADAASALEITYTRCPVTVVEKTLFLDAAEAVKFRPSWSVDGDVVVFPSRPENQPRAETVHVPLKYDDVAEAIKHLSK